MERLVLRIPVSVREKLAAQALANGRSMNAEAVAILGDALVGLDDARIKAVAQEAQRLQIEIDAAARLLHNLTDRRDKVRKILTEAELAGHVAKFMGDTDERAGG